MVEEEGDMRAEPRNREKCWPWLGPLFPNLYMHWPTSKHTFVGH